MSGENSDMQKSSRSESQVLMSHGFSVLGKWIKSSLGSEMLLRGTSTAGVADAIVAYEQEFYDALMAPTV
jgi:hypothetical protein